MTDPVTAPTFGADILPLFRPGDIGCMRPMGVRLNNPDWMTDPGGDERHADFANARRVFEVLRTGKMPPDAPWSETMVSLYRAWMAGGFRP